MTAPARPTPTSPGTTPARPLGPGRRRGPGAHPGVAEAFAGLPRVVDLLAARAEEHDRDAGFPYQGIEVVHDAGLLTLTVAERHGGAGAGLADTVRTLLALGRGDPSVALVTALTLLVHARQARTPQWPEPVYADLLADSVRGPALVAELGPGSDGGDPERTGTTGVTAHRGDGCWLLTGREPGVAGAEALAWMVVTARTDEEQRREGVFLVQGDSPGVQVEPTWEQLGLRATACHDVVFESVEVGDEAVVRLGGDPLDREPLDGNPVDGDPLDHAWVDLALPAVYLGVARAARDWLVRALRPAPGEGRGSDGRLQAAVGSIEVELTAAEELLLALARGVDEGAPEALRRTAAGRIVANRSAVSVVEQAVALSGRAGLSRAHPLERHLRDVLHARGHGEREHELLAEAGRRALEGR
ncbi:acyl-CoA dehydrogenase family protein [Streptacidiphilus carbonis]|uniref:acyl-CoA dehydrogenase family protein n=1 Tax=Streptacidiphilus carbonis TaxID=105422 RepID=UPI000A062927|nr:acyl-CoA dehydrogenase family protein [Streptacidiphilus carbonis]